jgi:hypothetical protein
MYHNLFVQGKEAIIAKRIYLVYFRYILSNETVEELLGQQVAAQVPLQNDKAKGVRISKRRKELNLSLDRAEHDLTYLYGTTLHKA